MLNAAESRYSVTHLEALAVVWTLKHFRDLLYGEPITVYTDHTGVTEIFKYLSLTELLVLQCTSEGGSSFHSLTSSSVGENFVQSSCICLHLGFTMLFLVRDE